MPKLLDIFNPDRNHFSLFRLFIVILTLNYHVLNEFKERTESWLVRVLASKDWVLNVFWNFVFLNEDLHLLLDLGVVEGYVFKQGIHDLEFILQEQDDSWLLYPLLYFLILLIIFPAPVVLLIPHRMDLVDVKWFYDCNCHLKALDNAHFLHYVFQAFKQESNSYLLSVKLIKHFKHWF